MESNVQAGGRSSDQDGSAGDGHTSDGERGDSEVAEFRDSSYHAPNYTTGQGPVSSHGHQGFVSH
jgi:hypothetical protein